jgi:hypothetical protein
MLGFLLSRGIARVVEGEKVHQGRSVRLGRYIPHFCPAKMLEKALVKYEGEVGLQLQTSGKYAQYTFFSEGSPVYHSVRASLMSLTRS